MSEDRLGMTNDQWESFQRLTRGFPNQNSDGIDLSLLRENLRMTPLERLRQLQRDLVALNGLQGDAGT